MQRNTFKLIIRILIMAAFAFIVTDLYARAGGAGGDSGSSGGGGGDAGDIIYIIYIILRMLPFPLNIIVVGIVIVGFIISSYYTKKTVKQKTIFNQLPTGEPVSNIKGYDRFIKNSPDFIEESFKNNVKSAFLDIQDAWQNQDLSKVRKFLSDGVYQRFNTQFKMMKLLQQTNTIEDIEIKNVYIDKVESDGLYDIIHTAIHASVNDHFVSRLDSSLNSGGKEEFVEYWSFLKKRNKKHKDIYNSDNCPNCGSPLPADMGEVSKCESCGTLTNSGEYDWVLSEITQADDYISAHPKLAKSENLTEKIREIINENDDFAVQIVEDKASNGYLQILTAQAYNDPAVMRRFVSDKVFKELGINETGLITAYNRIFLNDVFLVGVSDEADRNVLHIAVKSSYQRIQIDNNNRINKIDEAVVSRTEVIFMSRDKDAAESKGSLYAHSCPSCGAPVENSLNIACDYCGSAMNSTSTEWIITEIMSLGAYNEWLNTNKRDLSYSVDTGLIDKLYDVRDFAFNNVMLVIAADGVYADEERQFAEELAGKWGYSVEKLQPFFAMAQNSQLVIRMPEDQKKQKKIFKLMKKAAESDQNISVEEQKLLDYIASQYGLSGSDAA
jgi:predicted lipid-binding transport protein (Tim44 family)